MKEPARLVVDGAEPFPSSSPHAHSLLVQLVFGIELNLQVLRRRCFGCLQLEGVGVGGGWGRRLLLHIQQELQLQLANRQSNNKCKWNAQEIY